MSPELKRTRNSWSAMRERCLNPKNPSYPRYGARGITVCNRWLKFANFVADMGVRPEGKTLDRFPNGQGSYEPGNCRWATPLEQAHNSSRCGALIEFQGRVQSVNQWTDELGLGVNTLQRRLRQGWGVERALTTPAKEGGHRPALIEFAGQSLSARQWSRHLGLGKNTVRERIVAGLPIEQALRGAL